jgi:hypothetical protein
MPRRRFKDRERKSGYRDAKLIVIATEGFLTEKQYFNDLAFDDRYRNPRVHVKVLERSSTDSSPNHIIQELDRYRRENKLHLADYDELWLVIDLDRWGDKKLSDIAAQCIQKIYRLAVSTPCFEIWLLLHFNSLNEYTDDEQNELLTNRKINDRTRLEKELVELCGSYSKSNLDTATFIPHIETAIERARALDINPDHRWLNHLGTRVYLLAESIIISSKR